MEESFDARETLMLKLIEGEISEEERVLLEALLKESNENQATYAQLEKLWAMTSIKGSAANLDHQKGWEAVYARTFGQRTEDRPPIARNRSARMRRLAWVVSGLDQRAD